jgi:hypothetical protein
MLMTAAILFVPSGTWRFWQGWTLLAIVFTYFPYAFLYFYRHDREFIRTQTEKQGEDQRTEMARPLA